MPSACRSMITLKGTESIYLHALEFAFVIVVVHDDDDGVSVSGSAVM